MPRSVATSPPGEFPGLASLRDASALLQNPPSPNSDPNPNRNPRFIPHHNPPLTPNEPAQNTGNHPADSPVRPGPARATASAFAYSSRRASEEPASTSALRIVASSPTTGCIISAPTAVPAHYPALGTRRMSSADPRPASGGSSNSSSSSSSGVDAEENMPRWARPPKVRNSISGRARSFGDAVNRPDVDFDPELLVGQDGEWIEVIKGSEGRIAVRSRAAEYEVLVWLPAFAPESITVFTRGNRTVHIVADRWDDAEHAQWDIKLGEDANLATVRANYLGNELRIGVGKNVPRPPGSSRNRAYFRDTSSVRSAPAQLARSPATPPADLAAQQPKQASPPPGVLASIVEAQATSVFTGVPVPSARGHIRQVLPSPVESRPGQQDVTMNSRSSLMSSSASTCTESTSRTSLSAGSSQEMEIENASDEKKNKKE
ncbi:hypothetical protein M231_02441 [Tremella mesenterica]|uniref:SHSP domain-containing protein n=1 Tax=Tremella mesenterica TaxID=5217 RepID=A0A4V1M4G9_TREME|nr:hypothetical protein M231_02441 [Tremella mesenterica]